MKITPKVKTKSALKQCEDVLKVMLKDEDSIEIDQEGSIVIRNTDGVFIGHADIHGGEK